MPLSTVYRRTSFSCDYRVSLSGPPLHRCATRRPACVPRPFYVVMCKPVSRRKALIAQGDHHCGPAVLPLHAMWLPVRSAAQRGSLGACQDLVPQ